MWPVPPSGTSTAVRGGIIAVLALTQGVAAAPPGPRLPNMVDLSVVKSGPTASIYTSEWVQYTIVVTNLSSEIASQVRLVDPLPSEVDFGEMTVVDAAGGSDVTCASMPSPGANDAPIDCTIPILAPQSTATFYVDVQVRFCIGPDHTLVNTATVSSDSSDPDTTNNTSSSSVGIIDNGSCYDGNYCTEYDQCYDGVCMGTPYSGCPDGSVCTADSCDPEMGCVYDPAPGDQCADTNPCTQNACDPITGCVFPPEPAGVPCSFVGPCAVTGACDGQGTCTGVSVCSDGNPCTDDFTDVPNGCACSYAPTAVGTGCDDANPCTAADACDGAGACRGTPIGQAPPDIGDTVRMQRAGTISHVFWTSVPGADIYQVLRGSLTAFPVGPGDTDEACVAPHQGCCGRDDFAVPAVDTGFWYVVRGVNTCAGPGPYGFQGDHGAPGTPRISETCP